MSRPGHSFKLNCLAKLFGSELAPVFGSDQCSGKQTEFGVPFGTIKNPKLNSKMGIRGRPNAISPMRGRAFCFVAGLTKPFFVI